MSTENTYQPKGGKTKTFVDPEIQEKAKSKGFSNPIEKFSNRIDKQKTKTTFGVILILTSFYLFFACLSYFFTWKIDQDLVLNKGLFEFLFENSDEVISNWFGKMGAWVSHLLIYRWFGVSAFGFSLIAFIVGLKWLLDINLLPIKKTIFITLSAIVWFSLFLGFFSSVINYLGGSFGYFSNVWLAQSFGVFGAFLFHIALLYILLILLINPDFKAIFKKIFDAKSKELEEDDVDENVLKKSADIHIINTIDDDEIEGEFISETVHFDGDETEDDVDSELIISSGLIEDDFEIEVPENEEEYLKPTEIKQQELEVEIPEGEAILSDTETDQLRKEYGDYDPTLDLSGYVLPSIDLLRDFGQSQINIDKTELENNKNKIVETLSHYKIDIAKIKATVGPTVTLYEIIPAPGVRISKIKNLEDDIALSLSALGIRIIAPIPGKGTIGIEVPNSKPDMVSMRSLIASEKFQNSDFELPIVVGKTITNEVFTFDLTKMPHLLVAGATGQGKSVGLNAILVSILYKKHPSQVKFVLVDPKKVELTLYNKIERHFLAKLTWRRRSNYYRYFKSSQHFKFLVH
jgi:DNA segregation ATPase FtsK/SpoIIIE, S-DNA-T family